MGNNASRLDEQNNKPNEYIFYSKDPNGIELSPDLLEYLQNPTTDTSSLDKASIQNLIDEKVKAEIQAIRDEEIDQRKLLERSLIRHNLELEQDKTADTLHSSFLRNDILALKERLKNSIETKDHQMLKEAEETRLGFLACMKDQIETPLNCSKEVQNFKDAVLKLAQSYSHTIRNVGLQEFVKDKLAAEAEGNMKD